VSADRCLTTLAILFLAMPARSVQQAEPSYLPTQSAAQVLSVAKEADATAGVVVLTEALAIKETGPKETVARFGETYAFSPAVFAVYRDEPTLITFRNLQPDDAHDFMLTDPHGTVLMKVDLPSLTDTSYVFTFHREGIFPFYCTIHQPAMSGQIIVLPPKSGG
jgi:plastocyanin